MGAMCLSCQEDYEVESVGRNKAGLFAVYQPESPVTTPRQKKDIDGGSCGRNS